MKSASQMLIQVLLLSAAGLVQATLVLPVDRTTGLGCIREGKTVSYECTVTDISGGAASTVWQGSAFNCPDETSSTSSNRITLLHAEFAAGVGSSDSCGSLTAVDVGVNGNNYTSRLTLAATAELNGEDISCFFSTITNLGTDTIVIGAPPPSPENTTVGVTSNSSLTVSWTPPYNKSNVNKYLLDVTGEGCGCENMDVSTNATSVSCSGLIVMNQTCSFEVRTFSQDCGFTSPSNDPTESKSVVLSVPSSPTGQLYLRNLQQTCSFENASILLSWMAPPLPISYPSVQMYRARVNNGATMSTSGTEPTLTIPGSTFPSAGTYSFSVSAVNVLGESDPLMADLDVALTNVLSLSTTLMTSAELTFTLNNTACVGPSANIVIYYEECTDQVNCECPQNGSFSMNASSVLNSISMPVRISDLRAGIAYCYRSEVVNAGTIVGFENRQMFTTLPPVPPAMIASAILVSSNPPTYRCVNLTEGFNGTTSETRASFDPTTGTYSVPPCSTLVWLIVVIVIVVIVFVVGVVVGVILVICLVKKYMYRKKADDEKDITEKTPPPPDSLYADPNAIEHQAAPGTEDQYAMVDRKGKKNTKPKPTPPEALYQDPNMIEHETAASGDTYAVVDKPKKKGEPDVVPPANEGLTYADIDLSSKRPKPGSGRQAPQQPGEYPKEHPVEYSSVDHGNTSQL